MPVDVSASALQTAKDRRSVSCIAPACPRLRPHHQCRFQVAADPSTLPKSLPPSPPPSTAPAPAAASLCALAYLTFTYSSFGPLASTSLASTRRCSPQPVVQPACSSPPDSRSSPRSTTSQHLHIHPPARPPRPLPPRAATPELCLRACFAPAVSTTSSPRYPSPKLDDDASALSVQLHRLVAREARYPFAVDSSSPSPSPSCANPVATSIIISSQTIVSLVSTILCRLCHPIITSRIASHCHLICRRRSDVPTTRHWVDSTAARRCRTRHHVYGLD